MYIKQIVIDGFKSYAHRTEIGPFDPMFNAITGLNGSGKSNILDAICFLLGISNLSQVRAGTLQELVYKSGQAGVTKATVTITFDNSDKSQSPIGYQSHSEITVSRQVVIGGRNKYLINGSNAPPPRVQDLFRSVQLNVNNPHFLIMQGRITKVLNMKPPEILAMIEEAAGTRMYESKRTAAQKTIGKKDAKLKEIETILEEEITPTLGRLREERSSYLEYQKVSRELEHLNRLTVAHLFVQAEDWRKQATLDLDQARQEIVQLQQQLLQIEETLVKLSVEFDQLLEKRKLEAQGPMKDQEKKVEEHTKALTVAESTLKHSKDLLTREKRTNTALLKSLSEDEALLQSKKLEVESQHESYQELMRRVKETEDAVTAAQKHFQAVSAGLSSNADGQEQTLAAQKIARENEISTAQTQIKQAEMRLKNTEAEIKDKEMCCRTSEHDYAKDKVTHDKLQANIKREQNALDDLHYQEGHEEALVERKEALETEISQLSHKIDNLGARFRITYKDPVSGFDRSRVKGIVGRLVKVKDMATATALEVAAGGRLYQLVVDTETTSRLLLDNGKLSRRSTIIILSKITPRTISDAVVRKAKAVVGGENVRTALSLVDCEEEYRPAVQYVFGSYLVSNTLQEAKTVTFDKGILTSCVSLSGDVFNPSGTLTGGARPRSSAVLVQLKELAECEEQLETKQTELEQLKTDLKQVHQVARKYQQMKEQLETMVHQAELVWARMEGSTHHQQLVHLQQLKDSAHQLKETLELAKETESKAKGHLQDIQKKLEDAQGHRQRELQAAEDGLTRAQRNAEQASATMGNQGQEMATLQLEVEELEKSIASQQEQVSESSQAIVKLSADVEQHTAVRNEKKAMLSEVQEELNRLRAAMKKTNKELQQVESQQKDTEKTKSEIVLQTKEAEHKVTKCDKDSRAAASKVESLVAHYDWIATDRQYFGQPNTAYDFQATNPKEAQRKISKLQEQKDKLSKSVNMRAMNMLGKVEEKYSDLIKKKTIVEKDKAKIAELIAELDQKKKEALETAWKKVNKDFGSIFSMLLPGTMAKLAQPEGQTELTGLEVKVAFGAVWKENLTELSGGQRSLVALSLILSLLLFKPAPLYILDEVDAALDLSHTQNIGHMLRTHFGHSQFIVVSLKDGMFNNANVLFKTKFVDGVSTVTRYVNPRAGEVPSTSQKENDGRQGGHPLGQSTRSKRPRRQGLAADL